MQKFSLFLGSLVCGLAMVSGLSAYGLYGNANSSAAPRANCCPDGSCCPTGPCCVAATVNDCCPDDACCPAGICCLGEEESR
jgi:hypothetical protein